MPAGLLQPPFPTSVDPKRDPAWRFDCHVPGHPMPKGSPQPMTIRRKDGRTFTIMKDRREVMAWVAKIAAVATRDRMRRLDRQSFPYEAPVALECIFVFNRPPTQPHGPPVVHSGKYAVGDLDKLIRALGDALTPGLVDLKFGREQTPKASVIKDDSQITKILAQKAFSDEVNLELGVHFVLTSATGSV
jgi:Holliday junction resolvase RusA-like endonuclease